MLLATVIFGRQGGPTSTSTMEALLGSLSRSSTGCYLQLVHPRRQLNGRRQGFFVGTVLSSAQLSDLGGRALRLPAIGGGGIRALDCLFFICARVLFANVEAFFSNFWFFRASDVKELLCNLYLSHV
jgi:hypothetical protein